MTKLDERQLASLMKRAVPDRDPAPDLASRARGQASRKRRRRATTMGGMAAIVVAILIPTLMLSRGGTGRDIRPTTVGPSPNHPPSTRSCGRACEPAAVLAAIQRPLRLPRVSPGESCPVSPVRTYPGGAGFSGPFTAIGNGPLSLAGLSSRNPTVALSRDDGNWLASKVIWVFDRDYGGPLLLRGGRIDAEGPLGFSRYLGAAGYSGAGPGAGPYRQVLYVRGGLGATGHGGLESEPGDVFAQEGGCYAIQVDGVGFSQTLVFQARTAANSAE